jgi:hypothetical protein
MLARMRLSIGGDLQHMPAVNTRSSTTKSVSRVQPLACFNKGDLSLGNARELRGPGDSFNCAVKERWAAAGYLHDDPVVLSNLIDALHPKNLDAAANEKKENAQRRKALKDLKSRGPKLFDRGSCRALGDAYLVAMCPRQSVIPTINLAEIGKHAVAWQLLPLEFKHPWSRRPVPIARLGP